MKIFWHNINQELNKRNNLENINSDLNILGCLSRSEISITLKAPSKPPPICFE